MKPSSFERDESGCYFDRRFREGLTDVPEEARARIEALAAVRVAAKGMHAHMERWSEQHGLSEGRLQILFRLMHAPANSLAMADLANHLRVSPRNITGLVDNLEKDGLVERVPDPADRRSVLAHLTEKGREKLGNLWGEGLRRQAPLTDGFSEQELIQLRHLCLRLVARMNELNELGRNL
ncbi:MAG TPA: MarR family transcriptional regulator [Candidatus Dormibacteraeota bacterium]